MKNLIAVTLLLSSLNTFAKSANKCTFRFSPEMIADLKMHELVDIRSELRDLGKEYDPNSDNILSHEFEKLPQEKSLNPLYLIFEGQLGTIDTNRNTYTALNEDEGNIEFKIVHDTKFYNGKYAASHKDFWKVIEKKCQSVKKENIRIFDLHVGDVVPVEIRIRTADRFKTEKIYVDFRITDLWQSPYPWGESFAVELVDPETTDISNWISLRNNQIVRDDFGNIKSYKMNIGSNEIEKEFLKPLFFGEM